jgi:mono/diheme cytochrome c family protein
MRAKAFISTLLCLGLLAPAGLARAAGQGSTNPADGSAVGRGKVTFLTHCAVCHGDKGRGDGPAAPALTPRPTDLSVLRESGGAFPAARVEADVKGTSPVVAHGIPGMMIWGTTFLADANGNQRAADARIADLVQFIESIQRKR